MVHAAGWPSFLDLPEPAEPHRVPDNTEGTKGPGEVQAAGRLATTGGCCCRSVMLGPALVGTAGTLARPDTEACTGPSGISQGTCGPACASTGPGPSQHRASYSEGPFIWRTAWCGPWWLEDSDWTSQPRNLPGSQAPAQPVHMGPERPRSCGHPVIVTGQYREPDA